MGDRVRAQTARRRDALSAARRRVEDLAGNRAAVFVCFAVALAVYGLESVAWPLREGRDGTTYLMYYRDMWNAHPSFPELMLFRTPLAPLFLGVPLQLGGAILLEIVLGLAYAVSVAAYTLAALTFSRLAAAIVGVALLVYPAYGALFHQASSDSVFALALALWTLAAVRTVRRPSGLRYALLGAGVLALVLARPSAQLFLLFALVPLASGGARRPRLVHAGAFAVAGALMLLAWAGYNDARYGELVVARSASADVPFYRVFVLEKIVRPSNGSASRELAAAVRRDLLPRYRPRMTLGQFFTTASDRMWGDLVVLSDRRWGWGSDYSILRRVALEAIRAHPAGYVHDVANETATELRSAYLWPAVPRPVPVAAPAAAPTPAKPDPSNPGGVLWWLASTPDGHIRNTPSGLVWTNPGGQAHHEWLARAVASMESDLPNRSGSVQAASALNDVSRFYPRMVLWLALGLAVLLVRRPRGWLPPTALAMLGVLVVVATVAGMPAGIEYRLPFDPLFVLFAAAMLTLPSRRLAA